MKTQSIFQTLQASLFSLSLVVLFSSCSKENIEPTQANPNQESTARLALNATAGSANIADINGQAERKNIAEAAPKKDIKFVDYVNTKGDIIIEYQAEKGPKTKFNTLKFDGNQSSTNKIFIPKFKKVNLLSSPR